MVMLAVGAVLTLAAVGYAAFAGFSRSQSDGLTATIAPSDRQADFVAPTPVIPIESQGEGLLVGQFASLYPGAQVNPRYWNNPDWAGSEPFSGPNLPAGYEPTLRPGFGLPPGASDLPLQIRIPDIGMNETVEELELIVGEGDTRYEQPINIVGHIRGTANPGENGAGWYFGHQSNFGSSEGAVFEKLPDVFDLFRNDPVFVYIDTETSSYAYRVIGTGVEDREDLSLIASDPSTITLVTSWPPLVFDQRFLVFAELVGINRG